MAKLRSVSIREANLLSQEGYWKDNPKYDPNDRSSDAQPAKVFVAKHIVHHRPDRNLPEHLQYALVEEA